jgi:hypothetical protein
MADLEPAIIEKRFGTPAERIGEYEEITHWLYPQLGLDIAVDRERKEVFQYVMPREFEALVIRRLNDGAAKGDGSSP